MGAYASLTQAVLSIFALPEWKALGISTVPSNYVKVDSSKEFIKVHVVPANNGVNLTSKAGLLLIDIYTSAGKGPLASFKIADKLDEFLVGKSYTTSEGVTQLSNSSVAPGQLDRDNPSLYRVLFSIPFNHFGVS